MKSVATIVAVFKAKEIIFLLGSLIIGIGLRLYLAHHFYGNFDQGTWDFTADVLKHGENPYINSGHFNYFPVWAFILKGLVFLNTHLNLPFHTITRGFLTLVDLLTAFLLFNLYNQNHLFANFSAPIKYLLNPTVILLTGFHGQIENLAIFPLLISIYLLQKKEDKNLFWLIWGLGTLSIMTKHITLWAVWVIFYYTSRNIWEASLKMILSIFACFCSLIPFFYPDGMPLMLHRTVFSFLSFPNQHYGLSAFLSINMVKAIMILVMFFSPIFFKNVLHLTLLRAVLCSFVAFLFFSYLMVNEYLTLPLALGVFSSGFVYWPFSIASGIWLLVSDENVGILRVGFLDAHRGGLPYLWFFTIPWMFSFFISEQSIKKLKMFLRNSKPWIVILHLKKRINSEIL